jgi:tRNA(fMet)-specific endonuclease VapC
VLDLKLFDTSFLIDLVNGNEGALRKAEEVDAEALFKAISVVTVHKYLRGIYYLYMRDRELLKSKLKRAEAELARFEILPYTYEVAKIAAEIDATLALEGKSVSLAEVIIAATTLQYKLTLVTRNFEHFKRIPELNIEIY